DGLRMLIVLSYRPSDLLLTKHAFLQRKSHLLARGAYREIALSFLPASEIGRYLELEFQDHRFPAELPALIHAKTEGNPLFMTDLVRYLCDRQVITQVQGNWKVAGDLTEIEQGLPESARGMIEQKIAQLGEDDRHLLLVAGVQGYEFDSAIVSRVLDADPADVEDRLEELERVHSFVRYVDERELPDHTLT